MSAPHEQRWAEAIARDVIDVEPLEPSDQQFIDAMVTGSVAHQKERAFLAGLGQMFEERSPAGAMDPAARAMIDAVLVEIDAPSGSAGASSPEDHHPGRARRQARRQPRQWWGAVAVAGGLLAAGLVAVWWGNPLPQVLERTPVATPSMASSAASLVFRSGEVLIDNRPVARDRVRVEPGETIETREGTACLDFEHGGRVCLHPHSRVTIGATEAPEVDVEVDVEVGRVVGSLGDSADRALVLRGRSVVARASTEAVFSVEVPESDDERATLEMLRGQLDLPANDDAYVPAPGRRARDSAGSRADQLDPQRSRDDEALLDRSAVPERTTPARLWVESEPSGAEVRLDGRAVGRTPLSLAIEPGARSIELGYPGHAPVHEQLSVAGGDELERRFSLAPSAEPHEPSSPIERSEPSPGETSSGHGFTGRGSARTIEALVLEARARLAAGDYAEAARRYRTLRSAHPRSREARAALVSLGQLYLDRLGRPRDALKMFKRYLDGGRGPLAEEARWGRTQALRRLGTRARELAAIEAYLEHHPRSARASSLRTRLVEIE